MCMFCAAIPVTAAAGASLDSKQRHQVRVQGRAPSRLRSIPLRFGLKFGQQVFYEPLASDLRGLRGLFWLFPRESAQSAAKDMVVLNSCPNFRIPLLTILAIALLMVGSAIFHTHYPRLW